jgi:cytochrome c oxidase subunit I
MTPSRAATAAAAPAPTPLDRVPPGVVGLIGATDHKRIAARVAVLAFGFFVAGGLMAVIMRSELAEPGMQLVSRSSYNQLFSMHGSVMIYLAVTPLAIALGTYLVPLQIGAAELAAPRLALLASWLFLAGGVTMLSGFLTTGGAAKAGWTAFDPLSDATNSPGTGMDLWIFGVILAAAGMTFLAACVLATILARRAPGMTMLKVPVFSWSMVVTCLMVVMSFPVLVVAMSLLYVDRQFGGVFDGSGGAVAYQHLFWFYGHPVVYVMFFPFVGAVAEVVSVFSRKRFFGYRSVVLSLLVFAAISMSVWAHHMFATGAVTNQYFALTSTLLIVPAGIEYFDIVATMIGGSILLRTPMLFALGFLVQFLVGGLSGIFVASPPLDYDVHDTFFIVGHLHYTLFAGSLFGFFAGVYYWFPKVAGAMLRERLGKLHFWTMALGTNLTFLPMFFLGYDGMPRRLADYTPESGFQHLNVVSTVGAYVIAISVAIFIANVVVSLRRREPAGDDPWEGHTLEWATTSPPPRHNFSALPRIGSYAPLLDERVARSHSALAPTAAGLGRASA